MAGILDIIAGPFKALADGVSNVINALNAPREEKLRALAQFQELQSQLQSKLVDAEVELAQAQADVIKTEATGASWLQRNWRPLLMLTFTAIIFNNYILVPYIGIFTTAVRVLEFPSGFWGLLTVGVGGYIAGRTFEKIRGVDNTANGNGG